VEYYAPESDKAMEDGVETLKPHVHRNYLPGHKKGRQRRLQKLNALPPSISEMNDAVAYFGLRRVFGKAKVR
jgi:hypothetical protein